MPWKETCQMDERMQFIARVLAGEDEMTVLCREYGVSRKTGYKWLGRYIAEGAAGLAERSHAPLPHGQANEVAVVQAVLGLRQRWPHWGPKKLRVKLVEHHPELAAFKEHGLPLAIRSDNGPPFASLGAGGLSRLAVWWIKLGIRPEPIVAGKPQQNGWHERVHRTLNQEAATPPAASLPAQQQRFDGFRAVYNNERPHEALGQQTPASLYQPS
jgi:hypothetical protein